MQQHNFVLKLTVKLDDPSALQDSFKLQILVVGASVLAKLNSALCGKPTNFAQILALRAPLFNLSKMEMF